MKIKSLLHLALVLLIGQFLFACSSAKYYQFAAHKPEAFNKPKSKAAETDKTDAAQANLTTIALEASEAKAAQETQEPVLEASTAKSPAVSARKTAKVAAVEPVVETKTISEAEALALAKERIASMTKSEKSALKKDLREAVKQDRRGGGASIVEIILAVLLPPLAVFLHDGVGESFWINVILTLLFFVPGIVHALLVVTDTI